MEFIAVGESGKDYKVKITHGAQYTILKIYCNSELIYFDNYLPTLNRIAAENNAERIAKQYIK